MAYRPDPPLTVTCDRGDTVPITLGTADPITGAAATPSSVTCVVIQPDGSSDSVTLASVSSGLYRGYYTTSHVGQHGGKITTAFTSVTVIDRFFIDVKPA